MNFSAELISLLLPEPTPSIAEIEKLYPPRQLPSGAMVMRYPPSPTGAVHLGHIFSFLANHRLAQQSAGLAYLRIEDTDQKREVPGAVDLIVKTLAQYGISPNEGRQADGTDKGAYGPYTQSQRGHIYRAYIKKWLAEGKAYPCFCTNVELDAQREIQQMENVRTGYYGKYAIHSNITEEEVRKNLSLGKPFVIRFRATGDNDKMMPIPDLIKGTRYLPEYDLHVPIWKSEGLPTYHFAHLIDDHLMGTTHVLRGDEWFSSVPLHLQLFAAMGWTPPQYAHFGTIQKLDNGNRRKLSKRKDPEASMSYYNEKGYPPVSVVEYLLNLGNSTFEDWRRANPDKSYENFPFKLEKMGESGALFDFGKLDNISKEIIGRMSAEEVFQKAHAWAGEFNPELKKLLEEKENKEYIKKIFSIERGGAKNRKDIACWSQVPAEIEFFFDDKFSLTKERALVLLAPLAPDVISQAAAALIAVYTPSDDKDTWFGRVKKIAEDLGYATDMKEYKKDPAKYKGTVSDIAKIFRVLLCGRPQTPDLHSVMAVMGVERCKKRLSLVV